MDDYICWNKHGEEEGVNNVDGEERLHARAMRKHHPLAIRNY
jgi:hypothetical protein